MCVCICIARYRFNQPNYGQLSHYISLENNKKLLVFLLFSGGYGVGAFARNGTITDMVCGMLEFFFG